MDAIQHQDAANSSSSLKRAVVLDLGKKKRKDIKKMRKGQGKLIDQVESHLDDLLAAGTITESAQTVIVVVTEKPAKAMWLS